MQGRQIKVVTKIPLKLVTNKLLLFYSEKLSFDANKINPVLHVHYKNCIGTRIEKV